MKKINSKGFTLIELLAVITIMGILMLVAIPAVSRTIENSRRDTFADVAKEYINAVRNGVLADNIQCWDGDSASTEPIVASAIPNGTYFFPICTNKSNNTCADITANNKGSFEVPASTIERSTQDILESGGKSPFGNADLRGYVKFVINRDNDGKTTTTYYVFLVDTGNHGMDSEKTENLTRGDILTATTATKVNEPAAGSDGKAPRVCYMK